MSFEDRVELAGKVLDATGVLVITAGIFVVTAVLTARRLIGHSRPDYRAYRHAVGRVISWDWRSWSRPTSSAAWE